MKNFLYLFFLICCIKSQAQTPNLIWERDTAFGAATVNNGVSITTDTKGNSYVTGFTNKSGTNAIVSIKYDINGNQLWSSTFDTIGSDIPIKIVTKNDKVFVFGESNISGQGKNFTLIALDATTGNRLWLQTYNDPTNGDDVPKDMELDGSGNIYITGTAKNLLSNNSTDVLLIKYNSNGVYQWQVAQQAGTLDNSIYDLYISSNDRIYLPISTKTTGVATVKVINTSGIGIGGYTPFQYSNPQQITSVVADSNNNYYFHVNYTLGSTIIKVNQFDLIQGFESFPSTFGKKILLDNANNLYSLMFDTTFNTSTTNYYFVKLNGLTNGIDTAYKRFYNPTTALDYPIDMEIGTQATPVLYITGNATISGKSIINTTGYNTTTGNVLWNLEDKCISTGNKSVADLRIDLYNNIFITGSNTCSGQSNIHTVKYCSNATISISQQPQSLRKCVGQSVTFSILATGNIISYQWYKNGVSISGATNAVLSLTNLNFNSAGNYYCKITNTCNFEYSAIAILLIDSIATIIQQPISQSKCVGESVQFSVTTMGNNVTYQWRKNGIIINGAQSNVYSINSIQAADSGLYSCVVTSNCNTIVSANAKLSMCAITGIRNTTNNDYISISPNPTSGRIVIKSEISNLSKVEIFNILGSLVQADEVSGTYNEIDITSLPNSSYLLKVTTTDGESYCKKISKY